MDRKLLITPALLLALPASAASITPIYDADAFKAGVPDATTIDFNKGTIGVALAGEYDETGVSFSGHNGGQAKTSTFAPLSVPYSVIGGSSIGAGGGGFAITLPDPTNAFGIHVGGAQFTGNTVAFYNASEQLIAQVDVVEQHGAKATGYSFVGLIADQPIARVTVSAPSNDYVWYDDAIFGVVPEPTSLTALAAGAALLLRRRRA